MCEMEFSLQVQPDADILLSCGENKWFKSHKKK